MPYHECIKTARDEFRLSYGAMHQKLLKRQIHLQCWLMKIAVGPPRHPWHQGYAGRAEISFVETVDMGRDANLLTYATYQLSQGDKERWQNEVHKASANRPDSGLDTALTIQTEYSRLYRTEPLTTSGWSQNFRTFAVFRMLRALCEHSVNLVVLQFHVIMASLPLWLSHKKKYIIYLYIYIST